MSYGYIIMAAIKLFSSIWIPSIANNYLISKCLVMLNS